MDVENSITPHFVGLRTEAQPIVTEEQLFDATGYDQRGRLARCLDRHGIRYFRGNRGKIWTTPEELNVALRQDLLQRPEQIEFE